MILTALGVTAVAVAVARSWRDIAVLYHFERLCREDGDDYVRKLARCAKGSAAEEAMFRFLETEKGTWAVPRALFLDALVALELTPSDVLGQNELTIADGTLRGRGRVTQLVKERLYARLLHRIPQPISLDGTHFLFRAGDTPGRYFVRRVSPGE